MEGLSNGGQPVIFPQESDFLIAELVNLAHDVYLLRKSEHLKQVLTNYVLEDNSRSEYFLNSKDKNMVILVFKDEYLFAKEATARVNCLRKRLNKSETEGLFGLIIEVNYHLLGNYEKTNKFIQLIKDLFLKISTLLAKRLDELLKNQPLITHLKFLAVRILKKERDPVAHEPAIYEHIKKTYRKSFESAENIRLFISETYSFQLSKNEMSYLALHLNKLVEII